MLRRNGVKIVCYLDDFLVIGYSHAESDLALQSLIHILSCLGFPVNWNKVTLPATSIQFLGIYSDSVKQRIELPIEKLQSLAELAALYAERRKLT